MADLQPVEFTGPPSSSTPEPGEQTSVLDGMETVPAEVPAGDEGNTELNFGEEVDAAVASDGSGAGTLEEAAAYYAGEGSTPTTPPEEPQESTPPVEGDPGDVFYQTLGSDPEIGSETSESLKNKYGGDVSATMRGLVSGQKRLAERDEDAANWRAAKENPQAALQMLGVAPQQTPPDQQQDEVRKQYNEYLAKVWGAPEYKPEWEQQVEIVQDADGNAVGLKSKDGVDASIPQKLQAWHEFKRTQTDKFIQDPTTIWNAIAPGVQSLVDQRINAAQQQNQAQNQNQAQGQQFVETNAHWLYKTVTNHQGQEVPGPRNDANLSRAGKFFSDGIAEAREMQIPTLAGQVKWAAGRMRDANTNSTPAPQQQQETPPPSQTAPQAPGLDNGKFYDAKAGLSLDETIRRNLAAAGIKA